MNIKFIISVIFFLISLPLKILKIFLFSKKQDLKSYPFLNNNYAPVKNEEQFSTEFEIEGKIPEDLDGVFVRNGPNPKYPIKGNYHWFDGDGYLHEMELKDGKIIKYHGKYTRTQRMQNEDKAGERLYPLLGDIIDPRQFVKVFFNVIIQRIKNKGKKSPSMGTANTSIEFHSKRFFALVESDAPYQVVIPELKTLGRYDFEGKLNHAFTAHPKVDPVTDEMLFFGYSVLDKPFLTYSVISKEGKLVRSVPIDIGPVAYMIHDFSITENYSVFLLFPNEFNPLDLLNGKRGFEVNKNKQAKIAVIPRHGEQKDVRYFDISNGHVFHTVNAWEEGDVIHVFACKSNDMSITDISQTLREGDKPGLFLYKWSVDIKKGKVVFDDVIDRSGLSCEFPTVNPTLMGRKTKYCYVSDFGDAHNQRDFGFGSVTKFHLEDNKRVLTYKFPPNTFCGEFVFVSRVGSTEEDDGHLLSFVHDESTNISYFYILNAQSFQVSAKVKLQHRVPYGFHGKWVDRQRIDSQIKNI